MDNELFEELSKFTPALGEATEALKLLNPEVLGLAALAEALGPPLEAIAEQLQGSLQPVLSALANVLNAVVLPVMRVVSALFSALSPFLKLLAIELNLLALYLRLLFDPLGVLKDIVTSVAKSLWDALSFLTRTVWNVISALAQAVAKIGSALAPLAQGVAEFLRLSMTLEGANSLMSGFAAGIAAFTNLLSSGISSLAGAVTPFVQALNPNLVAGLNFAFRSLQATIGVALVPVAQALTSAMRQMAGILLPAMKAIGPALGSLTQALMTFVLGSVRAFADMLQEMTPLFELLAQASHVLVSAWDAIRAVLSALFASLKSWIGGLLGGTGDLKDFLKSFREGLHRAIEALLKFTVSLAQWFGATGFQANVVKSLRDLAGSGQQPQLAGAAPAPTDVGFRGFEDIAKVMAQASFAAQGGSAMNNADAKSEREWLSQMADSLEQMKNGGKDIQQYITDAKEYLATAMDDARKQVVDGLEDVADKIEERIRDRVGKQWRHWTNWVHGLVDEVRAWMRNHSFGMFG